MAISSDDYLEFLAQWTQGDRRDFARRWMENRGFTVTPLRRRTVGEANANRIGVGLNAQKQPLVS
jgi:hypothetical protein